MRNNVWHTVKKKEKKSFCAGMQKTRAREGSTGVWFALAMRGKDGTSFFGLGVPFW